MIGDAGLAGGKRVLRQAPVIDAGKESDMQMMTQQFSDFRSNFAMRAGSMLAAHIGLADEIAELGQAVLRSGHRHWPARVAAVRIAAQQSGFATVALIARTLESELADGGRMRAIACYMEALEDALDIDAAAGAAGGALRVRDYQEALLASLALRMHG